MTFQYTPYGLLSAIAALISLVIAVTIWNRRPQRATVPAAVLTFGIAIWAFANAFELSILTLSGKVLLSVISYIGVTTVPTAWLVFVITYTGRERWLTRRNLLLLAFHPVITMVIVATNQWHQLHWPEITLGNDGLYTYALYAHGPTFWMHTAYSYLVMAAGVILLIRTLRHSHDLYQSQAKLLLAGSIVPWITNIVFFAGLSPFPEYVDLTPLSFTIAGIAVALALFRFNFLEIVPVARDMVVDKLVDPVIVVDKQDRIVDANEAALQLLNQVSENVIGHFIPEALNNQPNLMQSYQGAADDSTIAEIEILVQGEQHMYDMRVTSLHDKQDKLTGRIIVLHDVTLVKRAFHEMAQARLRAEDANRLKDEFIANVSHELRTPLNAVIGYSDMLLMGMDGALNDKQQHKIERLRSNGQRLLTLVNDILNLSRLEAGQFDFEPHSFSPAAMMQRIQQQMVILAENKQLSFNVEIDPNLPRQVIADERRLDQVVVNLVSNAIKFTDEGHITVKACMKQENKQWQIQVVDTGPGIAQEAQTRIFEAFHQVDGSLTRKHDGTGLGLAIANNITRLMGGTITVESAVNKGSTFTVELPLNVPETQHTLQDKVYKKQEEQPA